MFLGAVPTQQQINFLQSIGQPVPADYGSAAALVASSGGLAISAQQPPASTPPQSFSIGPSFAPVPPIPAPTQAVGPTASAMGIPPAITAAQGIIATGPVLPQPSGSPDVAAPYVAPNATDSGLSTGLLLALAVGAFFILKR
jgi:hypothetical protein